MEALAEKWRNEALGVSLRGSGGIVHGVMDACLLRGSATSQDPQSRIGGLLRGRDPAAGRHLARSAAGRVSHVRDLRATFVTPLPGAISG